MGYTNLERMLSNAKVEKYAVGAFNIVDYSTTRAVIKVAEKKKSPVIIQTSTKTVKFYGYKHIVSWVKTLTGDMVIPVALHLDHCNDIDIIEKCIDAGWSSVMIDASSYPLEENIRMSREVVEMARPKNVTVEGELGSILGVEDDLILTEHDSHLADVESCVRYLKETGVDVLAPAIGTAHGVYIKTPNIDFGLLKEIAEKTNIPLAIHGGTGLSPDMFKKCIESGGVKVNISTNIKHLFKDALEEYFEASTDYEPIKAIQHLETRVMEGVGDLIESFGSANRA
ncbi:6-phospho-5-dehydro-2-deoxy-D-gluconate aldolase [Peptococcaceae bacterium CEB3]|nr:6-phospho-5-dehydro-2-deoxy-D-gluconate aldolase [Peptococcaceae bacterium CEB3]